MIQDNYILFYYESKTCFVNKTPNSQTFCPVLFLPKSNIPDQRFDQF